MVREPWEAYFEIVCFNVFAIQSKWIMNSGQLYGNSQEVRSHRASVPMWPLISEEEDTMLYRDVMRTGIAAWSPLIPPRSHCDLLAKIYCWFMLTEFATWILQECDLNSPSIHGTCLERLSPQRTFISEHDCNATLWPQVRESHWMTRIVTIVPKHSLHAKSRIKM